MNHPTDKSSLSQKCWYTEALCQGLTISFSEVLLIIWYSKHATSSFSLGLALTLPAAIGAITQATVTGSSFIHKFLSPKRLALSAIAVQICGLITIASALVFTQVSWSALLVGQCLYWMGSMTSLSPTQEILAKQVPIDEQNRFFSKRALMITATTLLGSALSALMLDRNFDAEHIAWFVAIAAVARVFSYRVITKSEEPKDDSLVYLENRRASLCDGISNETCLVSILKLSLCMFLFRFAVNLSSPFYSAYMLSDLSFSLMTYTLFTSIPLITKSIFLSNWARLLDNNRRFEGLFIAITLIGMTPIFWALSDSLGLLFVSQVASGISWSGFDLITILLVQKLYPRTITKNLGLFLALGSFGSVLGGVAGGMMRDQLHTEYQAIFGLSGVLRLLTGFVLLWYLRHSRLFRFHNLQIKSGIRTLMAVGPSLHAAAKVIPLHQIKQSLRKGKKAA